MIPITHDNLVSLKRIGNYQQNFQGITENNGKKENRDNINTWMCLFYSSNSWSGKT